jgi:hypothetical protein
MHMHFGVRFIGGTEQSRAVLLMASIRIPWRLIRTARWQQDRKRQRSAWRASRTDAIKTNREKEMRAGAGSPFLHSLFLRVSAFELRIITAVEGEWGYARNERSDRPSAMIQIPSSLPERGSKFNKAFSNLCWRPGGKTEDERWL